METPSAREPLAAGPMASASVGLRAYVSLWSADVLALGRAVDLIADRADGVHIDVFDGHDGSDVLFGPNMLAAPEPGRGRSSMSTSWSPILIGGPGDSSPRART
jgi:hypothetical protein